MQYKEHLDYQAKRYTDFTTVFLCNAATNVTEVKSRSLLIEDRYPARVLQDDIVSF